MAKAIMFFVIFTALIAAIILLFQSATGKQKIDAVKVLAFSAGCSIISLLILFGIVALF